MSVVTNIARRASRLEKKTTKNSFSCNPEYIDNQQIMEYQSFDASSNMSIYTHIAYRFPRYGILCKGKKKETLLLVQVKYKDNIIIVYL